MDTEKTAVIFRKFKKGGDIIAFFPCVPCGIFNQFCMSYMHIGQHGEADYRGLLRETVLASPEEYQWLKKELESIGYNLKIQKRISYRR